MAEPDRCPDCDMMIFYKQEGEHHRPYNFFVNPDGTGRIGKEHDCRAGDRNKPGTYQGGRSESNPRKF
jgi:hypothetical protein